MKTVFICCEEGIEKKKESILYFSKVVRGINTKFLLVFNLYEIPLFARCDGQYAARCTLNSCLVGVVIALPQKRSDESNGTLVDNTVGISCFGIRDYLDNYCPSLPCHRLYIMKKCWAGGGTCLNFLKYKMK